MKKIMLSCLIAIIASAQLLAQVNQPYQLPPKEILDLVDIEMTPATRIDSKGKYMLLFRRNVFKSLEELAEVELRLAGLRINPATNGMSRVTTYKSVMLKDIQSGKEIPLTGLPESLRITNISLSPDETMAAFLNTNGDNIECWVMELATGKCMRVVDSGINGVMGSPFVWAPEGKSLIIRMIPADRPGLISVKPLPTGPTVQESTGKKAPVRTYQDLLKNKYDEAVFDYYAQCEYVEFSYDGKKKTILPKGIYTSIAFSPDGKYLLSTTLEKPYSYIVPYNRFPMSYDMHERNGKLIKNFYKRPLIEDLPKGFDAVYVGKRYINWRDDEPATLFWAEAQDKGDPNIEAEIRDHLYVLSAPFEGEGRLIAKMKNRLSDVMWGRNNLAIVIDEWWKNRNTKTYIIDPSKENGEAKIIFDRSSEDVYADPGSFLQSKNNFNRYSLEFSKDGKKLYLTGEGCSPEGNKPFFDEYDIATGKTKRIWRAEGKSTYEMIVDVLDAEKKILLTRIESPTQNPNFYIRTVGGKTPKQITNFQNPYISFMGVKKDRIKYKRKDGIDLQGTLYLPKGYDKAKDGPLPVFLWAYPVEFKDADQAGQVRESPHRFTTLFYGSAVYWVMRGYAVLDDADFPIVGEGKNEPNDTFIEQLVANAEAAINTLADMGVGDRKRVAVGGHSYGAFMTANLLAHSDLFAAGIARSGAYNRTLTPFGFQSEERTFWDARNVYMEMSPFTHADKINEPLLLIHGDADNNPGTFTLQSERLFGAIKGLGGTARLVLLPFESHGYAARENILHMLWEMDQWLEKYVKNKK